MSEAISSPEIAHREVDISPIHEHKKMYQILGQNQITDNSLDRYFRDKERLPKALEKFNQEDSHCGNNNSPDFYKEKIKNAPEDEKLQVGEEIFNLIIENLNNGDVKSQINWSTIIDCVPYDENKAQLITLGLGNNNIATQIACADEVYCVGEPENSELRDRIFNLMTQAFTSNDTNTQIAWANIIYTAPKKEQNSLEEKVFNLMTQAFTSNDTDTQIAWAKNLNLVPDNSKKEDLENKIPKLIIKGLDSENLEDRINWAKNLNLAPEDKRKELFKLAQTKKELGRYLIEPPLYKNKPISNETFSRFGFGRTETEITLVGGDLKDKTIIRHIKPEAFKVWQKTYEDCELWEKSNFDYVPIEPIQSFKLNKEGLVDVYCGLLDLSLRSWESMSDNFTEELYQDLDRIREVLKVNGIKHGDTHDDNFCLKFFRDENGDIDFSKKPRIYLIDFEKATTL